MKARTASFYIGDDQWHCTNYTIESLDDVESETGALIRDAYRAWMAAGSGNVPDRAHFSDDAFIQSDEHVLVSRVEFASGLKDFRLFKSSPAGPTITTLNMDDPIERRGLVMEILECSETRLPMYQEVRTTVRRKDEHYWRLLLPVANDENEIVCVYIVHQFVSESEPRRVDFAAMLP